jgi:hypothetical protein
LRPSVFSTIPTPSESFKSLPHDLANAAVTAAAVLFITFPADLFNSTFEENYEEIRRWWKRKTRWVGGLWKRLPHGNSKSLQVARFGIVLLVGTILNSLIDPHVRP